MRRNHVVLLIAIQMSLMATLSSCAAPSGFHNASLFGPILPDHPCQLPYIASNNAIEKLNASRRLPHRVIAIALSPENKGSRYMEIGSNCHVTVTYDGGASARGVLTFYEDDYEASVGLPAGFAVYWTPDQIILTPARVRVCQLSERISECVRSKARFPEPDSLRLAVSPAADPLMRMAIARGDVTVALKLVALQTCYFSISQMLLNNYGADPAPDSNQRIVQDAVSNYDYSGWYDGQPLYKGMPLGVFTQSYLYGINPTNLATIVIHVSTDALASLDAVENHPREHRLDHVSDALDLVNTCAQQHSNFITYH